jgi:DNA (cytosine-5)-methyltransferase 1
MLAELGYGFAYRVLDAQYFGVAQRRRRVFVVGCLGNWRSAAAVLFERNSLCGNPAPSREKGEGITADSPTSPQYGGSNKDVADTVTSKWAKGSGGPANNECGLFVAQPIAFSKIDNGRDATKNLSPTIRTGGNSDGVMAVMQKMAVRRLTPIECERLQGFPDNYTNIKDNCPDGPRYKALGNSMAVPVMRWIGERIQVVKKI